MKKTIYILAVALVLSSMAACRNAGMNELLPGDAPQTSSSPLITTPEASDGIVRDDDGIITDDDTRGNGTVRTPTPTTAPATARPESSAMPSASPSASPDQAN